jgi:hypothetical protein
LFVIKIEDLLLQQEHPLHHQQQRVLLTAAIFNATSAKEDGTYPLNVQVAEI